MSRLMRGGRSGSLDCVEQPDRKPRGAAVRGETTGTRLPDKPGRLSTVRRAQHVFALASWRRDRPGTEAVGVTRTPAGGVHDVLEAVPVDLVERRCTGSALPLVDAEVAGRCRWRCHSASAVGGTRIRPSNGNEYAGRGRRQREDE